MKIRIDYGRDGLDVDLPDERVTVIEPTHARPLADPASALGARIRAPTAGPPLHELARPGRTVAISVCDITRAQPREAMVGALRAEMPDIADDDITLLVATGTHRANTAAELESMLGSDLVRRHRVVNHDCRDLASLEHVGDTSTGVRVMLNRAWMQADLRITTGFVEPHFFAGFSGGPKMVAPGLAGLETVLALHDARRIADPRSTWGITKGNPIHDDVREIARMTGVGFALDVTLDRAQAITQVFAGELFAEHAEACDHARRTAMTRVERRFDVVLTTNSGYPLDQNLYQAVKGMSAASAVVKPGGTIVCAAECRDGVPDHGAFGQILRQRPSAQALLEMITTPGYSQPDQWQVQVQSQIQLEARVLMKADGVSHDTLRAAHLEPVDEVGQAVRDALAAAGPDATLCVLPQGPQTIPYVP